MMRPTMALHPPARRLQRALRHALIALALLFAQQAAQFHAMSHLGQDLGAARNGEKGTAPLDHSTARCIAFQAIGSALICAAPQVGLLHADAPAVARLSLPPSLAARIELRSRGPPPLL